MEASTDIFLVTKNCIHVFSNVSQENSKCSSRDLILFYFKSHELHPKIMAIFNQ